MSSQLEEQEAGIAGSRRHPACNEATQQLSPTNPCAVSSRFAPGGAHCRQDACAPSSAARHIFACHLPSALCSPVRNASVLMRKASVLMRKASVLVRKASVLVRKASVLVRKSSAL